MKTTLEMARKAMLPEAWISETGVLKWSDLERLVALARADERNSWPSEMEAMERQVNILTDALNDRQRWFDAIRAQHKRDVHYWQDQTLNARADEREACANVCEEQEELRGHTPFDCAVAIRARSGEQK